ncbi:MAG: hypothetical protein Hyperionvirus3_44 [Hyperionvirus sp.]|uniref:Uncharacterized protein n=1 Tax=Hyperionvirus sp. TaxID=2487770 RepID=A0A3G5A6U6_9VIRU|nr:MAG: hypothetical protein Hyperionvirus3_44 [Hyperionvirus sp.]
MGYMENNGVAAFYVEIIYFYANVLRMDVSILIKIIGGKYTFNARPVRLSLGLHLDHHL